MECLLRRLILFLQYNLHSIRRDLVKKLVALCLKCTELLSECFIERFQSFNLVLSLSLLEGLLFVEEESELLVFYLLISYYVPQTSKLRFHVCYFSAETLFLNICFLYNLIVYLAISLKLLNYLALCDISLDLVIRASFAYMLATQCLSSSHSRSQLFQTVIFALSRLFLPATHKPHQVSLHGTQVIGVVLVHALSKLSFFLDELAVFFSELSLCLFEDILVVCFCHALFIDVNYKYWGS